ncbi:MAG: hypothetical protein J6I68_00150 [Butyrivibrio sp.]|uniref:hypothetical protein n=1 Tax=Butyrivibrio sp. TaxID=28121 RepID=UPI001B4AAC2B|nr:hypothetical protein [Butyrivibrio sp.]MBP3781639.1 hypothetical protein [Butyrivibrio sp.]
MAYPYLALRPNRNVLVSHYVVVGSKNPTALAVWSVKLEEIIETIGLSKSDVEKEAELIRDGYEPTYCALIGFGADELFEVARKMEVRR